MLGICEKTINIDNETNVAAIDLHDISTGTHLISLIVDNNIVDHYQIIKK